MSCFSSGKGIAHTLGRRAAFFLATGQPNLGNINWINKPGLLSVQEVLTHMYGMLLYEMCQDFLDIRYYLG